MLRLLYAPLSPFARKVRVAAIEAGVDQRIDPVVVDVWNPESALDPEAPLGQIPVLLGGPVPLPGSTLICEYLTSLEGATPLVPSEAGARWRTLRVHALADGIMTAAVAHTVELFRRPPEFRWPGWLDRQKEKISCALGTLEAEPPSTTTVDLGTITLGCTLAYLDRRLPEFRWRRECPALADWLVPVERRPSMVATAFPTES